MDDSSKFAIIIIYYNFPFLSTYCHRSKKRQTHLDLPLSVIPLLLPYKHLLFCSLLVLQKYPDILLSYP